MEDPLENQHQPRTTLVDYLELMNGSAIGQHLIKNPEYAKNIFRQQFSDHWASKIVLSLVSVLESVYIKAQNPVLSKQKELIFSLGLFK